VKKRELNRKRKRTSVNKCDSETLEQPTQPPCGNPAKDDSELVSYLSNLLGSLEHRRVSDNEVETFIKEVRQRGFKQPVFYPYIDKKEKKQPP